MYAAPPTSATHVRIDINRTGIVEGLGRRESKFAVASCEQWVRFIHILLVV